MLSAIAARKAAQAASRETSGTPLEIVEPANTVQSLPSSNPSSKRKPSSQKAPNPTKRKKKGKDKEKRVRGARYFQQSQQDLFEVQEDVITIDSDEQGDSAMSEDQESYETPATLAPLTNKRRWSPSRALDDSSDEEKVEDDERREDVIIDNHTSTSESQLPADNPDILSTFQSILNQNMFFLTSDQVHNLGIPSSSHGAGTVLALGPGETVCFLGAYTFCVLQGSISLCGVTIAASRRAHRVFAPRSSPLPILEGISGIDMIGGLTQKLPEQIFSVIGTHVTLVLLQELRTGVEGLGRVCRTFNGVFEPSRWQNNSVLGPSLQIEDVHTVRVHPNISNPHDIGV
jgi:polynucleotide 5'-hydroxyl-kinase GRC3/NOL9